MVVLGWRHCFWVVVVVFVGSCVVVDCGLLGCLWTLVVVFVWVLDVPHHQVCAFLAGEVAWPHHCCHGW